MFFVWISHMCTFIFVYQNHAHLEMLKVSNKCALTFRWIRIGFQDQRNSKNQTIILTESRILNPRSLQGILKQNGSHVATLPRQTLVGSIKIKKMLLLLFLVQRTNLQTRVQS